MVRQWPAEYLCAMFNLMGKVAEAKERMETVRQGLGDIVISESEMDGAVIVTLTAARQILSITLGPSFHEKFSPEEQGSLLTEAVNNALMKAEARGKAEVQKVVEEFMPSLPGMDMGKIMDMLG